MAFQDFFDNVQKLYIAYYQRPADPGGLRFWAQRLEAAGGSLEGIIEAFATSQEAISLYDTNGDGEINNQDDLGALIDSIYQALFGRAPDAAGKNFYLTALQTGQFPDGRPATPGRVALDILNGAQASDQVAIQNKLLVANRFTQAVDGRQLTDPDFGSGTSFAATYVGDTDAQAARAFLATVTGDPATVKTQAEVISEIQTNIADPGDPILTQTAGQTFTLTTGLDNVPGTNGNDTINGTHSTLTLGDVIDGAGGTDTLYIGDTGSKNGVNFNLATIKSVENLIYQAANGKNNALDLSGLSGLQAVTYQDLNGTAKNVTINTKGNATSVSVKNAAAVTVSDTATTHTLTTVSIDGNSGAATVTSDALTNLSLANTSQNATVTAAPGTRTLNVTVNNVTGGTITDNNATTVIVTGTGAASSGFTLTTDAATSIAFAGDKTVSLALADTGSNSAVVTAITSTNTAGVTITNTLGNGVSFTGGDGKDEVAVGATTKTIDMGTEDDTVTVTSALGTGGSLNGGDGTDTLAMTAGLADTLSATDAFSKAVSGFEKLSIGQVAAGGNVSVNMANMAGINYVVSAGTAAATGTPEVQTVTFTAADVNGGVLKFGGVDITIPSGATDAQVASAVHAQAAAILAANPNLDDISLSGNQLTLTYKNTAGDVPNVPITQNGSSVTFGVVTTTTSGVDEVPEQQKIQVTAVPAATGLVEVNVLGTPVQFTVTAGQTKDQVAATTQAALSAANITGVNAVTVSGDTVTIIYEGTQGNAAAAVFTDLGTTGVTVTVTDNFVSYVAPVAEVQEVQITHGTDVDGGEIVVNGARIALAGNLSVDQVGVAITGQLLAIQAVDPTVDSIAYNTATDKLTITYKASAGDVSNAVLTDNTTTGVTATVTEVTLGVPGAAAGQLALTNLANGATVEFTADSLGAATVALKDASGSADVVNVVLNGNSQLAVGALNIAGVETINVTTTDSDALADPTAPSTLTLNAPDATKIVVSGNHGLDTLGSNLAKVVTFDASGVNSTLATGAGAAAAVTFSSQVTNQNVTVTTGNGDDWISVLSITDNTKGATVSTGAGDDTVFGSVGSDTLNLGDGNDLVHSSGKADNITLGAGKDAYVLLNTAHSTIAARDVITDFQANTVGQGPGGAVTSAGAAALAQRNGDVIDLSSVIGLLIDGVRVGVFSNAADAQTFVQNGQFDSHNWVNAALDSTTGYLYLDVSDDGVVDSVIQLTGVTTINEAAFVI